jgi:plasmid stabilization system protein ParE
MKVRILESARRDLRAGYNFYERQERGVGEYFLNSLFADIDSLTLYGGIQPLRFGFHCMLASRFPYAVYYRLDKEVVVVRGVLDCRRDPAWITKRLSRERTRGSSQ